MRFEVIGGSFLFFLLLQKIDTLYSVAVHILFLMRLVVLICFLFFLRNFESDKEEAIFFTKENAVESPVLYSIIRL